MKLRNWILCFGLFLFAVAALDLNAANPPRKPNILLILADDLGFENINCYGGTSYKTPNIDALAKSGTRFANSFSTPLCSPSRVELMTGRYGFRTSWINLIGRGEKGEVNDYFDPKKETTFGRMLKNAGYATAIAGKWQLCDFPSNPNHLKECGFDKSLCWAWVIEGKATSRYWAPVLWGDGELKKLPADKYGDDLFSDYLIDFMKQHKDEPFFAYYPMALVHAPHVPPPGSPRAAAAKKFAASGKKMSGRKAKGKNKSPVGKDDELINDPANYPDMVAYMDKMVGKMVAAVDRLGLSDNTLIIFTGDNGTDHRITSMLKLPGATRQHADIVPVLGGKGTVTELGSHVPMIARWPGKVVAGNVNSNLVQFCDILPTLAEIGEAKLPHTKLDGRSFAPQLLGKKGNPRDWIFTQLGHKRLARNDRFLLHDDGRIYDIPNDLFEKNDLSTSDKPDVVAAKKQLQAVLDQCK
jgi:arylsulfatase A